MTRPLNIVTLCTGNVARSVMLGYMLTTLAEVNGEDWAIRTSGTHVGEGSAMSGRTREALTKIEELGSHPYGAHRSHQLTSSDCEWADILLAAEAGNVLYVRRNFASVADKTVQLGVFVRFAPLDGDLTSQLAVASHHGLDEGCDVADPAGGDQATYDACARELWDLAQSFATIVSGDLAS